MVKDFNSAVKKHLNSTMVIVLLAIAKGMQTNKEISRHLGLHKSLIHYHLSGLVQRNLIKRTVKDIITIYELTEAGKSYGSNFSTMDESKGVESLRLHNLQFVVSIVAKPPKFHVSLEDSNWVAFYPRNYIAWERKLERATLIFRPNSLEIYLADVYADSPERATINAVKLVYSIIEEVEAEYPGLRLGKPQEVARITRNHYALQHDPLAVLHVLNNMSHRSDRLHIDHSDGIPELETVHKTLASEDVRKITRFYEDLVHRDFSLAELLDLQALLVKNQGDIQRALQDILVVLRPKNQGDEMFG